MKYFVWALNEDDQPIYVIKLLSNNKKKLRGKWQMFVKETIAEEVDEVIVKGYTLTTESSKFAVYNDREERIFNSNKK